MEDTADLLFSCFETPRTHVLGFHAARLRCVIVAPGGRNRDRHGIWCCSIIILPSIRGRSLDSHRVPTSLPDREMVHVEKRQMDRPTHGTEETPRPIQQDRLAPATKNRELETETRLDPTPMAHTQHNRTDQEPIGRLSAREHARMKYEVGRKQRHKPYSWSYLREESPERPHQCPTTASL